MREPIMVLQVMGTLNRGGAESMIMNIFREIDSDLIHFDFVTHGSENEAFVEEILSRGSKIYYCPRFNTKTMFSYKNWWENFFACHEEYSVLHSHMRSTASIYLPLAKKNGMKTIIHSHSTSNGTGISSLIKKYLQYPLKKEADFFFGCSREASEWLFGKKIVNSERYYMINNPIDTNDYVFNENTRKQCRKKLNIADDEILVTHVGRFHESKNHVFLISVFKEFISRQPNSKLMLVGDGDLRSQIEQKVETEGLNDKVLFLGIRKDVPALLQAADIFAFPSNWEGLPVSVVEAQATGLPCIVSDKVSKDVCITDLVQCVSIEHGPSIWVDEMIKAEKMIRRNTSDEIIKAGFDVHGVANWLTGFYRRIAL